METVTAQLNNLRISPRKVRLVADYMRGKKASMTFDNLSFVDKRAAEPLQKLLQSALSNAKNRDIAVENLFIQAITVNSGETLYRRMPAPRGRAMMIRKKTSKITIVLSEKQGKKALAEAAEPAEAASAKPAKKAAKPKTPKAKETTK